MEGQMPIERIFPGLEDIVSMEADIEILGTGYDVAEGPLWFNDLEYLLFSDIRNNRRMKWTTEEGVTLNRQPTNHGNGLTRDPQGRLIACEHLSRSVTRLENDGNITVVANKFGGVQLNTPNDVVVKSDGSIYFTDPTLTGQVGDMDYSGVYRVSPDLKNIDLVARDFPSPNGLAFSPDEKLLYINDFSHSHIRVFEVQSNGLITNDRLFYTLKGIRQGSTDGMKVDKIGNVYCTGPGGVWIINPDGQHLGTILTGSDLQTTNCAWGEKDGKTLFITTRDSLMRIRLKIPGVEVPAVPHSK